VAHLLTWRRTDAPGYETAHVVLDDRSLVARGTQVGVEPHDYRLDYEIETGEDWVTRRVRCVVSTASARTTLSLRRRDDGSWVSSAVVEGEASGPAPGCDADELSGTTDVDIAFSPLTNTMPLLRTGDGEPADYDMAWVSVPDLQVHRSLQRYEPAGPSLVRFVARDSEFRVDLEVDSNGFVFRYPGLAERLTA
jgi:hypothetical protein